MASSTLPLLSGISGKIGPVVAYVRNNKQFIREYTVPRDPKTPAQVAHRAKISLVNKELSPFSQLVKQNYGNDSRAYRSLVGKTIRDGVVGAYPNLTIDYSSLLLAEGDVLLPEKVMPIFLPDLGQLTVHWDSELRSRSRWCQPDDQINLIVFHHPDRLLKRVNFVAQRSEGTVTVELPNDWNPSDMHCWVYFTNREQINYSNSVYVEV